jgi:hypothetical protein
MFTGFDLLWPSIIFFLACIIVLHVLFIWIFPQNAATWKKVDYIWLSLACLGILTATAEVRRKSANMFLPQVKLWAYNDFSILRNWVREYQKGVICNSSQFQKTKDFPPDFDERIKQMTMRVNG